MAITEKKLAEAVESQLISTFYKGNYKYNLASGVVQVDLAYQTAEIEFIIKDNILTIEEILITSNSNHDVSENFAIARKILHGIAGIARKLKLDEIHWAAKGMAAYTLPKLGFIPSTQGWKKMADAILRNAQKLAPTEVEIVEKILKSKPEAIRIIAHSPHAEKLLGNLTWLGTYNFLYDRSAQKNFDGYMAMTKEEEQIVDEKIKAHIERVDEINQHMGL